MRKNIIKKLHKLEKFLLTSSLDNEYAMLRKMAMKDFVLTEEYAKEHGLEHMLPTKELDTGANGQIFSPQTQILQFLYEIFVGGEDKHKDRAALQQWVNEFLEVNGQVFEQYKIKKYLNSGKYADAWELEDGRVIKFMRDDKDLGFYKQQIEELHDPKKGTKHNLMVYDYGTFDMPLSVKPYDLRKIKNMSWVVMEKLVPLRDFVESYDSQLRNLAENLKEYAVENPEEKTGESPMQLIGKFKMAYSLMRSRISGILYLYKAEMPPFKSPEDLYNYVVLKYKQSKGYIREDKPIFDEVTSKAGLPKNWLDKIIPSIVYHELRENEDLHSGNVGFRGTGTGGEPTPIYYDPSNRPGNVPLHQQYKDSPSDQLSSNETYVYPEDTINYEEYDESE